MESIRIARHKFIQFAISVLAMICIMFLAVVAYILMLAGDDWVFNWEYATACGSIAVGGIVISMGVFLILRLIYKDSYYIITPEYIKMYKRGKEVFTIPSDAIGVLNYISIWKVFLLQFGSGYLFIEYNNAYGQISPSVTRHDGRLMGGTKMYEMSMSAKQAQRVSLILRRDL